jgi:hypothetical protein
MMAAQRDLWGDIVPNAVRTPAGILKEQAAILGDKTQHLVEAEVTTSVSGQDLVHTFELIVPTLDGYRYQLFSISHGPTIYPVEVRFERTPRLNTEEAFVGWLRDKLSSTETRSLISNLLAQAQS